MRRGFNTLAAQADKVLELDPYSGHLEIKKNKGERDVKPEALSQKDRLVLVLGQIADHRESTRLDDLIPSCYASASMEFGFLGLERPRSPDVYLNDVKRVNVMSNWRVWGQILSLISTVSGLVLLTERRFEFEIPTITDIFLQPYMAIRHVFFQIVPDFLKFIGLPSWSFRMDEQDLIIISVAIIGLIFGTLNSVVRKNGIQSTFSALFVAATSAVLVAIIATADAGAEEPFFGEFSVHLAEIIQSFASYLVSSSADSALLSALQFVAKGLSFVLFGLLAGWLACLTLLIMAWLIDVALGMHGTLKLADTNTSQDNFAASLLKFVVSTFQSLFAISASVITNLLALGLGYLSAIEGFFLDRIL